MPEMSLHGKQPQEMSAAVCTGWCQSEVLSFHQCLYSESLQHTHTHTHTQRLNLGSLTAFARQTRLSD